MRRFLIGFVVLAALAVCCLIPGTPVNNDPSDAARTAGIHLSQSASPRLAVTVPASFLAAFVVALASLAVRRSAGDHARPSRVALAPRSIDLARADRRRGPPAFSI